jgi:DNA-binding MarR family transcriptional regulator
VLETLAVYGPMIQRDLADALAVSSQTMVRQVDRMVASGWLRRGEVEHDRRATRVGLTAEGRDVHRRLVLVAQQANARLIRGLSDAEVKTFHAVLNRILANIDEAH